MDIVLHPYTVGDRNLPCVHPLHKQARAVSDPSGPLVDFKGNLSSWYCVPQAPKRAWTMSLKSLGLCVHSCLYPVPR